MRMRLSLFHPVTVVNQSDPIDNDPVTHSDPLSDHEEVFQLIPDENLAMMRDIVFVDEVDVPLVEPLECCPLRDDEGVLQHSLDRQGAGLTVTQ
jgi:hypothetical protein